MPDKGFKEVHFFRHCNIEKWFLYPRAITLFFLGLVSILSAIWPLQSLMIMVNILTFLAFLQCLTATRGIAGRVGLVFFILGLLVLLLSDPSFDRFFQALRTNSLVLSLLIFVYLFAIPLGIDQYRESLSFIFSRITTRFSFYSFTFLVALFLGIVLNIACIPLTKQAIDGSGVELDDKDQELYGKGMIRGFSTTFFWSPNSGAVGLVVAFLGLRWTEILGEGLMLALIGLGVGLLFESVNLGKIALQTRNFLAKPGENKTIAGKMGWKVAAEMVTAIIILLVTILVLDVWTGIGTIVVVSVVALFFPLFWCAAKRALNLYAEGFKRYLQDTLPGMKNEVFLFLSAGFFGTTLTFTGIDRQLAAFFQSIAEANILAVASILLIIIVGLSVVGLHPVITLSILAVALPPMRLNLDPEIFAVILLGSWGIAIAVSPFSASNLIISGLLKTTSFKTGLLWNGIYGIVMTLVFLIYLQLLQITRW